MLKLALTVIQVPAGDERVSISLQPEQSYSTNAASSNFAGTWNGEGANASVNVAIDGDGAIRSYVGDRLFTGALTFSNSGAGSISFSEPACESKFGNTLQVKAVLANNYLAIFGTTADDTHNLLLWTKLLGSERATIHAGCIVMNNPPGTDYARTATRCRALCSSTALPTKDHGFSF
ncbi:hypothetical protein [Trinickia mobilis]|uniref:hypothetical protein n=1 Tax=Trinickia mobilis TaxID=2816356 RepID=UPI001A8C9983|nr:hypothetical protein [Trinickia mobilis]